MAGAVEAALLRPATSCRQGAPPHCGGSLRMVLRPVAWGTQSPAPALSLAQENGRQRPRRPPAPAGAAPTTAGGRLVVRRALRAAALRRAVRCCSSGAGEGPDCSSAAGAQPPGDGSKPASGGGNAHIAHMRPSTVRTAEAMAAAQQSTISLEFAFRRWRQRKLADTRTLGGALAQLPVEERNRFLLYLRAWQRVPDELKQQRRVPASNEEAQYNAIMDALRESGALGKEISLQKEKTERAGVEETDGAFMFFVFAVVVVAGVFTYLSVSSLNASASKGSAARRD
eukprot:TRINITY_DN7085_c0_g1_i1.p1 TRINITY_DN7085_c0_g1~~TRINITY_DN7085_c0_g1_i1.p1  ORF type:complete len:285 (+),score=42.56 TRINITY_DN7085_c0_g1_i1:63-917(+)